MPSGFRGVRSKLIPLMRRTMAGRSCDVGQSTLVTLEFQSFVPNPKGNEEFVTRLAKY
jgi:hypothetical protein